MEEDQKQFETTITYSETKISEWIKQGEELIFPERLEEWESCVEARANGMYNGDDLNIALDIIETLDNGGSLWDARQLLESKDHSQGLYAMVVQIVFAFSKQGPEFLEYTMDGEVSPEAKKAIEAKRKENLKLSLIHNKPKVETYEDSDNVSQISEETNDVENISADPNKYLQIRKDTILTKIVTFIRKIFFWKKYKDNITKKDSLY